MPKAIVRPFQPFDPVPARPLPADVEHRGIDVRHRHLSPRRGEAEGDVAGAAGHVEDLLAAAGLHPPHEHVLPVTVEAARHEVVHQVVAAGDIGEDAADPLRLLLGADILEAERNLVHRGRL